MFKKCGRKRFLRVFKKLEKTGFRLFVLAEDRESESYKRKVRNYIKNTNKVLKLYNKYYG